MVLAILNILSGHFETAQISESLLLSAGDKARSAELRLWTFETSLEVRGRQRIEPFCEKIQVGNFWGWHDALWIDDANVCSECAVNCWYSGDNTAMLDIYLTQVKGPDASGVKELLGVLCISGLTWFVYVCVSLSCWKQSVLATIFCFQVQVTQDMPRWSMPLKLTSHTSKDATLKE